mgnify:FL=1
MAEIGLGGPNPAVPLEAACPAARDPAPPVATVDSFRLFSICSGGVSGIVVSKSARSGADSILYGTEVWIRLNCCSSVKVCIGDLD